MSWPTLFVCVVLCSLNAGFVKCTVMFEESEYVLSIPETPANDSDVPSLSSAPPEDLLIRCFDDQNASSTFNYVVTEGSSLGTVNHSTGVFSIAEHLLDYETKTRYTFRLLCTLSTDPSTNASATLTLNVAPVNEYLPVISPGESAISIQENAPLGIAIASQENSALITFTVSDRDGGPDNVVIFTLSEDSGVFELNQMTGELRLASPLDTDALKVDTLEYNLRIVACNEHVVTSNCNYLEVNLDVTGVNDIAPQYQPSLYSVSIPESLANGSLVVETVCIDGDYGQGSDVTISFNTNTYSITLKTFLLEANGEVVLQETLDYEDGPRNYSFELVCSDGTSTATAQASITVLPVNDIPPRFLREEYEFEVERSSSVGHTVGQLKAEDGDVDGGGNVTYYLDESTFFSIDESSGTLRTKDHIPSSAGSYFNLTASATDGNFSAYALVVVTVSGAISQQEFIAILVGVLLFIVFVVVLLFLTGLCALCYIRATRRRAYGVERVTRRDTGKSGKAVRFADDEFSQYFPHHDMVVSNKSAITQSSSSQRKSALRQRSEEETAFTALGDDNDTT